MKSLVILLLFTFGLACHSVKETPNENNSKETNEQPVNTTAKPRQFGIPGRITFKAKVKEIYVEKKNICGVEKSNVAQVEVLKIMERGSGITNLPTEKEVILVSFLLPPKNLGSEMIIQAKAKESLCPTASKTYFTINSYKILE